MLIHLMHTYMCPLLYARAKTVALQLHVAVKYQRWDLGIMLF